MILPVKLLFSTPQTHVFREQIDVSALRILKEVVEAVRVDSHCEVDGRHTSISRDFATHDDLFCVPDLRVDASMNRDFTTFHHVCNA